MTQAEFDEQVRRLVGHFGKSAMSPEKAILIWREVENLSRYWFIRVVDQFIGEMRQVPLISDFRLEIAKERERLFKLQRQEEKQDAKDFWDGTYHPDEVKEIMRVIKARIMGRVPDDEWNKFVKMLEEAANQADMRKKYKDTG